MRPNTDENMNENGHKYVSHISVMLTENIPQLEYYARKKEGDCEHEFSDYGTNGVEQK